MDAKLITNKMLLSSTVVGTFSGGCLGASLAMGFHLPILPSTIAGAGMGSIIVHTATMMMLARAIAPTNHAQRVRSYANETAMVEPDIYRVQTMNLAGDAGKFGNFPAPRKDMIRLARGLVQGIPFTESIWTGTGRPFTVRKFSQIRAELVLQGWAVWRNKNVPQRGCEITEEGLEWLTKLATSPLKPRGAQMRVRPLGRV